MINPFSHDVQNILDRVHTVACQCHDSVYLVGGPVRDYYLNQPVTDLDFVVVGDAINFAKVFARSLLADCQTHIQFKTARVELESGLVVDFVTARKEVYPRSGHLPVVEASSIKDDLYRRDFTINAMAMSLRESDFGVLVDPYSGKRDIEQQQLRVLHEGSFDDDPTRLLRLLRFKHRLNFKMEVMTQKLFEQALMDQVLKNISAPRFFKELQKVCREEAFGKIFWDLQCLGFLEEFAFSSEILKKDLNMLEKHLPEILYTPEGCAHHDRVWFWVLRYLLRHFDESRVVSMMNRFQWQRSDKNMILRTLPLNDMIDGLMITESFSVWVKTAIKEMNFDDAIHFWFCQNETIE